MWLWMQKVVELLLQPSSLVLIALLLALFALFRLELRAARRWVVTAFLLFVILGLSPLADFLTAQLEDRFPRPDLAGHKVDGIILLGGSEIPSISETRRVPALNLSAKRLVETAMLARRFPEARVIASSGLSVLEPGATPGGQLLADMLEELGIAKERIEVEPRARTTWENALFVRDMLGSEIGPEWLLVTSAWHMPRSVGAFRKLGMNPTPFPVDYRTPASPRIALLSQPASAGLFRFDNVLREYPGLLYYWLAGRSNALFPRPG